MARSRRLTLSSVGPIVFAGDQKDPLENICRVQVVEEGTLRPAKGVRVEYRIIAGAATLGERKDRRVTVASDSTGHAGVTVMLQRRGAVVVEASLAGNRRKQVFFTGHSEKTTHEIHLYGDPVYPAKSGMIRVRIRVLDFHGAPVGDARLKLFGLFGSDSAFKGKITRTGNGEYRGILRTRMAGPWIVQVEDAGTKVSASRALFVTPDKPNAIKIIGSTDPRSDPPYGQLLLRARLEDRYGNSLDPHRLRCAQDGRARPVHTIRDGEARFTISSVGYSTAKISLKDEGSSVRRDLVIPFSAVWLEDPGMVTVGSTFRTRLFALPPPDRKARKATIDIQFDPKLVAPLEVPEQYSGNPQLHITSTVKNNTLILSVESERPVSAKDHPDGLYICDIDWKCRGEGDSCFYLVGKMSPSTPKWELCVAQKRAETKCICINLIYQAGDAAALAAGTAAANQVPTLVSLSSNLTRCCPYVRVVIHRSEVDAADWAASVAANVGVVGGNPAVVTTGQRDALWATRLRARPHCINLYMLPVSIPMPGGGTAQGFTQVGPPGTSVLDTTAATTVANVGAHEVGHALGLTHASAGTDTNNLMHDPQPHGQQLNSDQCKTIWQTIDNYYC